MIFKTTSDKIILAMRSYRDDLFSLKIEALINSYGDGYDFCSYFYADGAVLSKYYGDFVLSGRVNDKNAEEIARFLQLSGFSSLLCEISNGKQLGKYFQEDSFFIYESNIMKYSSQENAVTGCTLKKNPPLDEVFEIVSKAFELDYESWYVDASHRLRHGISDFYTLENASAVVCSFDIRNMAFLSQVATVPSERGKGLATKMLGLLCNRLTSEGKEISLICLDQRLEFYKKAGFVPTGKAWNIKRSIRK